MKKFYACLTIQPVFVCLAILQNHWLLLYVACFIGSKNEILNNIKAKRFRNDTNVRKDYSKVGLGYNARGNVFTFNLLLVNVGVHLVSSLMKYLLGSVVV